MFNEGSKNNHAPICNFVPGYAFYNDIGYGLAEVLVNIFERLLDFRRKPVYDRSDILQRSSRHRFLCKPFFGSNQRQQ